LQEILPAYLTGIARAGKRLVAVGERGIVVLSDDDGATWRQASVPVSVTLAAVQFPTPTQGWVVGHYGVVLRRGQPASFSNLNMPSSTSSPGGTPMDGP
jgi:photosystem II stability/assembly factor-like uncharacterized protein